MGVLHVEESMVYLTLIVLGGHDKYLKFQFKIKKKIFFTNTKVKTETWSNLPPPITIKEYFTPIILGLREPKM